MIRRCIPWVLMCCAAPVAWADPADARWHGVAGASFAAASGNTESLALQLTLDLERHRAHDKTSVSAYVNEGRSKDNGDATSTTTAGKWGVSGQYDRDLDAAWYGFGKLSFEHDRVVDLTLRSIAGAGLGYHLIQTDALSFDVFGGLSYTVSRYSTVQTIDGSTARHFYSTGGLLGEESSHQFTDTVSFKQRLEYYPAISGSKSQLLKFNALLGVSMTKTLSLSVGLTDTYDSQPAEGRKRNDASLFTGVNVKL